MSAIHPYFSGLDDGGVIDDAVKYLPGGVLATLGHHIPGKPDTVLSHGNGAYIYSNAGDRFLDVVLGSGSLLLGHCPPAVVSAVRDQLERGTIFGQISGPSIELARLMVEAIPCADKVRFTNSGTEAVLLALRLARAFTTREKILKFEGAYHGFADSLLFHTNYGTPQQWPRHPQASPDTLGIPAALSDLVLIAPYNDIDRTREIVRDNHAALAAVFVEPVMRGIATLPGFLDGLRQMTSEYRVPLVFDEVITGFRIAYGGAQEHYGVTPDLAIYGKGLGAGYPIGAVVGRDEIMSFLDPTSPDHRRIYALGSTHGNALSATAAVANLKALHEPGIYGRLNGYGDQLGQELSELFVQKGMHVQLTGVGSIVEFFFSSTPVASYRDAMATNLRLKHLLGREMPRHGVYGGGGRFNASTCHGDEEIAMLVAAVDAGLSAIRREGDLS